MDFIIDRRLIKFQLSSIYSFAENFFSFKIHIMDFRFTFRQKCQLVYLVHVILNYD